MMSSFEGTYQEPPVLSEEGQHSYKSWYEEMYSSARENSPVMSVIVRLERWRKWGERRSSRRSGLGAEPAKVEVFAVEQRAGEGRIGSR
jgi:hypothetical protein